MLHTNPRNTILDEKIKNRRQAFEPKKLEEKKIIENSHKAKKIAANQTLEKEKKALETETAELRLNPTSSLNQSVLQISQIQAIKFEFGDEIKSVYLDKLHSSTLIFSQRKKSVLDENNCSECDVRSHPKKRPGGEKIFTHCRCTVQYIEKIKSEALKPLEHKKTLRKKN